MSDDKIRSEFEVWYLEKFCGGQARLFRCVNAEQVYYFTEVQSKWDAWQASRQAIKIELPTDIGTFSPALEGFEEGINYAKAAIEAAGLKVKP